MKTQVSTLIERGMQYLSSSFAAFTVLSIYSDAKELDIIFQVGNDTLQLFRNTDPYFTSTEFVIFEA